MSEVSHISTIKMITTQHEGHTRTIHAGIRTLPARVEECYKAKKTFEAFFGKRKIAYVYRGKDNKMHYWYSMKGLEK